MQPRFPNQSRRIAQLPLMLGIPVGLAVGIIGRNLTLGMGIVLFCSVLFLHTHMRPEGRKEVITLAGSYAATLLALVLAAFDRPEAVWSLLFLAALINLFTTRATKPTALSKPPPSA